MTRDQAKFALDQIASTGNGSAWVAIFLNSVGRSFVGSATYAPDIGLIAVDGTRAFVRPEQVSAIAVAEGERP